MFEFIGINLIKMEPSATQVQVVDQAQKQNQVVHIALEVCQVIDGLMEARLK